MATVQMTVMTASVTTKTNANICVAIHRVGEFTVGTMYAMLNYFSLTNKHKTSNEMERLV